MIAEDDGRVHAVYCLRGEDVDWLVEGNSSPGLGTVEVIFRDSKGYQGRKGAVLVRMKGDGNKGGEAVELY